MRTITTYTTRQIATALANQEDRDKLGNDLAAHLVNADDEHVERVKLRLDSLADFYNYDKDELRGAEPAELQEQYILRRDRGAYDDDVADVTL